jgi:hypothetical protein
MHKPFMGISTPQDPDGPIFVQTMNQGSEGKLVNSLGNSDMQDFKTNDSAINTLNSPSTKSEFGLGSGPSTSTSYGSPSPATRVAPMKVHRMGQLDMKSGEFWGVVGLAFAGGVLGKHLFDTYVK